MFGIPDFTSGQWTVFFAVVAAFIALSFYSIWDAFRRDFPSGPEKFIWMQVCVLVPFLGGVAYLLFGKKRGKKTHE